MLAGQLGHGVGRDGFGQHSFVLGQRRRVPVGRRRGRVNHPPRPGGAGGHQQIQRSVHAIPVGARRIFYRARHRGQRRLVEDDLDSGAGLRAGCRIGQVALNELHRFQARQVGALSGDEAVDAAYGFATRQQRRGNRAADKPRHSGHKIACQKNLP